ncbi:MAG: oligopeptide transporter, OPT family [Wenzhouxiangellaceae bacterium]
MAEQQGLATNAHRPLQEGETYQPFVPAQQSLLEMSLKAMGLGVLFGIIFGAANAYLGLRAGLTISTSIPVAVMTVAAFRILARSGHAGSILEANIAQTTGSASSSLASGIIFTLPALWMWGVAPDLGQMVILALTGGLLGVLFMIPLRRFLIDREHGKLPYPEGTACAEVLVASQVGGNRARGVFWGLGVGALLKVLTGWLKVIPDHLTIKIPFINKAQLGVDVSAALFGVGYILGPRVATIMVGGGLLSWLLIIPILAYWGADMTSPLYPETVKLISNMSASELWTRYVRYIGAGAVATAGIITLIRSIPVMLESFRIGMRHLGDNQDGQGAERTSQDLPLKAVGLGVITIILLLTLVPAAFGVLGGIGDRLLAAVLVVIFAFFFVTVSSRIVGLVGVTSNPTSGMTIATLMATATVFLLMGWTDTSGKAAALIVGCVVAIAASMAGDTSQDLKTGFLLGATPRRQQLAEMLGIITASLFVCLAVVLLAEAFGFGSQELPAPQATLMKLVIDGVIDQSLPWGLVAIGVGIALVCEVLRIPSLPFAVGVYLPVSTLTPIFLGGLLRWWLERRSRNDAERDLRRERGILLGSGFVGGEGLAGVALAAAVFILGQRPQGIGSEWLGDGLGLALGAAVAIALLAGWFYHQVVKKA